MSKITPLKISKILDILFPHPEIPLHHADPYTLLIAVMLSAQCTDERVNRITPALFALAKTPEQMVKLGIESIEALIRSCGLSSTKARAIWNTSKLILERHHGQVPSTFAELEALPGVGHKTASVVLCQGYGIAAFPVDTHIHRCAHRWGLSSGKNVFTTERDLKGLFPESQWNKLHLQMILFARKYCPARGHDPHKCPICSQL